jgi:sorting and assembly machinery component 37
MQAIQRLTFPQTYLFYSLDDNYWKLTNPAITFMHPIPQRYYVPARIRELHRPHSFSDTKNKYGLACEQDKVKFSSSVCLDELDV